MDVRGSRIEKEIFVYAPLKIYTANLAVNPVDEPLVNTIRNRKG